MTEDRPSTLPIERSIYVANLVSAVLYGLYVYMVFQSWHHLKTLKQSTLKKRRFYVYYSFIQLFLVTVELSLNALTGQLMWIDHRDFPGGPFAYFLSASGDWFGICVLISYIISTGMTNGLLLYRCFIIWNGNWRVVALPCLLYLSEVVMGVTVPIEIAISNTTFLSKPSTNFSIPWISLVTIVNTTLTALIIGRIVYVAHKTKSNSDYTGLVSMLIESALPLSLVGIAFAVCVAQSSLPTVPLAMVLGTFVAISPQLIILRVAMGRAFTENMLVNDQLTENLNIEFARSINGSSFRNDAELQSIA
ncbi:hypothetical protein GALMADRAFT_877005 [Galerina marginata CBS 339.88]|uniref:Uncharacterized protein n=1 Tax=Galerina marginata (strain CBS 339.88) TaxID=685588 RepID=A0A067TTM4_GALM3|nr:hypothetical protein GALMADRAFT_877005 [Galerina marginata CBS 339.88]